MTDNSFEAFLCEADATAAHVAADTVAARAAVWHNHLSTGESVRKVRTADRTDGKVRLYGTNGNGIRSERIVSTVGAYTARIRKSAERQYFDRQDALERRSAAALSWQW